MQIDLYRTVQKWQSITPKINILLNVRPSTMFGEKSTTFG